MLHITDINYMAPRYHPGRTIVPATKDRFTNNLPDLSQLLCVPINTNELDKITSNMGTIFKSSQVKLSFIVIPLHVWTYSGTRCRASQDHGAT